jgi:HEAT repeat protein
LLLKGRDNPELTQRIDDLLARLGEDKMQYLHEEEIRGLGDHCVLPLTRYIQSDHSALEPARSRRAAEILSDCAQPWCIPHLIELLRDQDGDVRAAAGRALIRVSHHDIGTDEQRRNGSDTVRADLIAQWQQWWNRNKSHIPGATSPELPKRLSASSA